MNKHDDEMENNEMIGLSPTGKHLSIGPSI